MLVEGKKILAVGPNLHAGGAAVIDARGRIVMPGFIDTHHHQFETALRSFLADGILINDGTAARRDQLLRIHPRQVRPVYRPQDVYINELFGALSQLDAGVTTVHDISQIHHSPEHSDAAIQGCSIRAAAPPSAISRAPAAYQATRYPQDAARIKKQWFSSTTSSSR